MRTRNKTRGSWPAAAGLLVAVLLLSWVPSAGAQDFEVGAPIDLRGSATGTVAHLGAVDPGPGTPVVDAEVAFSSAVADADADGVNGAKLNEVSRRIQPPLENKFSYAKGTGLEVGVAQTSDTDNQLILAGKAEQDAPPDNDAPAIEEIAVDGDPLAYASVVRGEAIANAQDNGLIPEVCVLGDDISRGKAHAADVQLIDTGGDEAAEGLDSALVTLDDVEGPAGSDRNVSQSTSRTRLVPTGQPNNFGLMSEVRQTIAPITLLQATQDPEAPRLITIELLGEWVLRVVTTGSPGGATVHYGPGEASPQTNILRIIDSEAAEPLLLTFQDLLGETGLQLPAELAPVIDVSLAEDPRAIAAPGTAPDPESQPALAADGTSAAAAVDVLRVRLLDGTLTDLRVGHMEVTAEVPAGGVNCPIPVTKTADPRSITLGTENNQSEITITVHNDFDCDLEGVVLTDRIRQLEGDPDFSLTAAEPTPDSPSLPTGNLTTADVVWSLGDIPRGEERSVSLTLQTATKGGIIRDIAEATGTLANCVGQDVAGLAIAGLNLSGLSNPVDIAIPLAVTGAAGFPTAAAGAALSAGALALAAMLRRRRR